MEEIEILYRKGQFKEALDKCLESFHYSLEAATKFHLADNHSDAASHSISESEHEDYLLESYIWLQKCLTAYNTTKSIDDKILLEKGQYLDISKLVLRQEPNSYSSISQDLLLNQ